MDGAKFYLIQNKLKTLIETHVAVAKSIEVLESYEPKQIGLNPYPASITNAIAEMKSLKAGVVDELAKAVNGN